MKKRVVLRADGSSTIGFGHVYRLMALAEILSDFFDCIFLTKEAPPIVRQQLEIFCKELFLIPAGDEKEEFFFVKEKIAKNDILVLDGYNFSEEYQIAIKGNGNKLVCLDDTAERHFFADVVINHAEAVNASVYQKEAYTKLYLGVQYALLRKPFLELAKKRRELSKEVNIFIAFGGTDAYDLPLEALRVCQQIEGVNTIYLVLGNDVSANERIQQFVRASGKKIHLKSNASAIEMIAMMELCKIAIVSASTISYELSCVQIGMIAIRTVANQQRLSDFLCREGLAQVITFEKEKIARDMLEQLNKLLDNEMLIVEQMSRQHIFFDGCSGEKLISVFHNLAHD